MHGPPPLSDRKHALKKLVAGALVACGPVFAAAALSAASFSDPVGDDNEAPDITSVHIAESVPDALTITVSIGNFQTLPTNSWLNIWFDLDSDQGTGDAGDEALLRYLSDGGLRLYVWNGTQLVERETTGVTGSFAAGVLRLSAPKVALGVGSTFGILAVSARGQSLGDEELIASDYAPDSNRSAYAGPASTAFPDPADDQDAAPDIASIRVSDAKNGWVSFAIGTPNYASLPGESIVALSIDADNRLSTGEEGADVRITSFGGEFELERWNQADRRFVSDDGATRLRMTNAGNVVTVEVHRSELGTSNRLGFAIVTADINASAGAVVGFDVAPDDAPFFSYAFANKLAVTLTATRLSATPAQPRAGRRFAVKLAVRQSDTGRGITSGTVACRVLAGGKRIPAKGSIAGGGARCSLLVPAGATGQTLRGTITVRSGGASVSRGFAYRVR